MTSTEKITPETLERIKALASLPGTGSFGDAFILGALRRAAPVLLALIQEYIDYQARAERAEEALARIKAGEPDPQQIADAALALTDGN